MRRQLLLLTMSLAPAALAQAPPPAPAGRSEARPPDARGNELDRAFAALRAAPDEAGAALVESRIQALWSQAASPAVTLLLRRGVRNLASNDAADALEDCDAAIILAPQLPEGWLLRGRAQAQLGDAAAAARDLQEALRLEPRHWPALLALAALQEERGDLAGALRSFQAALEISPRMPGGQARLRALRRKALGEDA